jgi:hypothetical protein
MHLGYPPIILTPRPEFNANLRAEGLVDYVSWGQALLQVLRRMFDTQFLSITGAIQSAVDTVVKGITY